MLRAGVYVVKGFLTLCCISVIKGIKLNYNKTTTTKCCFLISI